MSIPTESVLSVVGTRRPARIVEMHTARVQVTGTTLVFEVIRAGLAALHLPTTPHSVTVVTEDGEQVTDIHFAEVTDQTVTVTAFIG